MLNSFKRKRKFTQIENVPEEVMDKWMNSHSPITLNQAKELVNYLLEYQPLNTIPYSMVSLYIEKSNLWADVDKAYKKPDAKELLRILQDTTLIVAYVSKLKEEYRESLPVPLSFFATAETVVTRQKPYFASLFIDQQAGEISDVLGMDFGLDGELNIDSIHYFQAIVYEKMENEYSLLEGSPGGILLLRAHKLDDAGQLLAAILSVYEEMQIPVIAAFARDDNEWYSFSENKTGKMEGF